MAVEFVDRCPGMSYSMKESDLSHKAFEDFFAMGPTRTLAKLAKKYEMNPQLGMSSITLRQLKWWRDKFDWSRRILERDAVELNMIKADDVIPIRNYRWEMIRDWDKVTGRAVDLLDMVEDRIEKLIMNDEKDIPIDTLLKILDTAANALDKAHNAKRTLIGMDSETGQKDEQFQKLFAVVMNVLPPESKEVFMNEFSKNTGNGSLKGNVIDVKALTSASDDEE